MFLSYKLTIPLLNRDRSASHKAIPIIQVFFQLKTFRKAEMWLSNSCFYILVWFDEHEYRNHISVFLIAFFLKKTYIILIQSTFCYLVANRSDVDKCDFSALFQSQIDEIDDICKTKRFTKKCYKGKNVSFQKTMVCSFGDFPEFSEKISKNFSFNSTQEKIQRNFFSLHVRTPRTILSNFGFIFLFNQNTISLEC